MAIITTSIGTWTLSPLGDNRWSLTCDDENINIDNLPPNVWPGDEEIALALGQVEGVQFMDVGDHPTKLEGIYKAIPDIDQWAETEADAYLASPEMRAWRQRHPGATAEDILADWEGAWPCHDHRRAWVALVRHTRALLEAEEVEDGGEEGEEDDSVPCSICGATEHADNLIASGWMPYYYLEGTEIEQGPCCAHCAASLREGEDGEYELPLGSVGHPFPADHPVTIQCVERGLFAAQQSGLTVRSAACPDCGDAAEKPYDPDCPTCYGNEYVSCLVPAGME